MPATRPPKLLSTTLDISKRGKFQRAALALDTEERKLHLICALPPLPSRLDLNPLNVRTHLFRLTASGGESNSAKYGAKKGQATGRSLSAGKKKKKKKGNRSTFRNTLVARVHSCTPEIAFPPLCRNPRPCQRGSRLRKTRTFLPPLYFSRSAT